MFIERCDVFIPKISIDYYALVILIIILQEHLNNI